MGAKGQGLDQLEVELLLGALNTRILGRVAELDMDEIHTVAFTLSRKRFRDESQPAAAPESRQAEAGFP